MGSRGAIGVRIGALPGQSPAAVGTSVAAGVAGRDDLQKGDGAGGQHIVVVYCLSNKGSGKTQPPIPVYTFVILLRSNLLFLPICLARRSTSVPCLLLRLLSFALFLLIPNAFPHKLMPMGGSAYPPVS
jgi:hypothetical protein